MRRGVHWLKPPHTGQKRALSMRAGYSAGGTARRTKTSGSASSPSSCTSFMRVS